MPQVPYKFKETEEISHWATIITSRKMTILKEKRVIFVS